jgi:energy-converting hydrogenase Eha subunit G
MKTKTFLSLFYCCAYAVGVVAGLITSLEITLLENPINELLITALVMCGLFTLILGNLILVLFKIDKPLW